MADMNHNKREYKKECTIEVNVGDRKLVTATMLINTILKFEFVSDIYACVPKGYDSYDVTLPSVEEAKLICEEELRIDGQSLAMRLLYQDSVVVSFMHLPPYIDDWEIEKFLIGKGATLKGEIKHRLIKNTDISDGTRYVRVQFSEKLKSLPYSVGFNTLDGYKYFRVLHNNQVKVCFKCNSENHEIKECPLTKCYKCGLHGHVAKNCSTAICDICGLKETICDCYDDYGQSSDSEQNYDSNYPPLPGARAVTSLSPEVEPAARESHENDNDNEETEIEQSPCVSQEITCEASENKLSRRNSDQWQLAKRARRSKLMPKISDQVLKDNDYKNKIRESRKDESKKKKELHVNEKRDIVMKGQGSVNKPS